MKKSVKKPTYRKKTRELLIKLIFQMTSTGDFSDTAKDAFLDDKSIYTGDVSEDMPPGCIFNEKTGETPDIPYFNWAFLCLKNHLDEIDQCIEDASEKWKVDRMSIVDLAILRVATAELIYMDEIEKSVSVNEAVLMAKKYGSEKSAVFINGVLGAIVRSRSGALS